MLLYIWTVLRVSQDVGLAEYKHTNVISKDMHDVSRFVSR